MAATTGHSINTEPYGENTGIYSSLTFVISFHFNLMLISVVLSIKIVGFFSHFFGFYFWIRVVRF
jgi:hypothetical protein